MTETVNPDLCVIGAGAAGLAVAAPAAMMGLSVVLIEKARFGGQRSHVGGLPSQALAAAALAAQDLRRAALFGVAAQAPAVDFARVRAHVRDVQAQVRPAEAAARWSALGIRTVTGTARFTQRRRLEVGSLTVEARRFVVATGSSPIVPSLRGLETVRTHTCDTIFDLDGLPEHLVVLGGDPRGVELAQTFRRLGSAVTLVTPGPLLDGHDPELVESLRAALEGDGLVLHEAAEVSQVDPRGAGLALHLQDRATPLIASHLLVAAGRLPNVEGLGLEVAGVTFDRSGIKTGRGMRTSNRRIHAVGDVVGSLASVQSAEAQASLVLRDVAFRSRSRPVAAAIPRATFTDPQIAEAGLTEAQARQAGHKVTILRWPFAETDRGRVQHATRGHVKVVCDRRGTVLGAGVVGSQAGELIGLWQLAVNQGTKIGAMAEVVLPYPTFAEASTRAALLSFGTKLRSPWLRRWLRWMRLLG